jgi:hypothetical protein
VGQISVFRSDLTKGSTRFLFTIDYKNTGLTWDPIKTPNTYHISLMVYLKKIKLEIIELKLSIMLCDNMA